MNRLEQILLSVRHSFRSREIYLHEGTALKRVTLSTPVLLSATALACVAALGLIVSVMQLYSGASVASFAFSSINAQHARVASMEQKLSVMQAEIEKMRVGVRDHAALLDQRDALLASIIAGGKADINKLAAVSTLDIPPAQTAMMKDVRAPLSAVETHQNILANQVQAQLDVRAHTAEAIIQHLGLTAARFTKVEGGVGGPFEPVTEQNNRSEQSFHALFQSWKHLDSIQQGASAIPAIRPVDAMSFTSNFGVRTDPFTRGRAMHPGIDIPGAYGTNIYATADGTVNRAGRAGGYGNMVELDHGHGIMTRYGHLSSFVVAAGEHVHRGQLIAHMGSTGRSTGTHLHYEVRIDGNAVNPVPFLQSTDYLATLQKHTEAGVSGGVGGPESTE